MDELIDLARESGITMIWTNVFEGPLFSLDEAISPQPVVAIRYQGQEQNVVEKLNYMQVSALLYDIVYIIVPHRLDCVRHNHPDLLGKTGKIVLRDNVLQLYRYERPSAAMAKVNKNLRDAVEARIEEHQRAIERGANWLEQDSE